MSLDVSMRLFPFKNAIKLLVLCRYNVRCLSLKGKVMCSYVLIDYIEGKSYSQWMHCWRWSCR